jgi:hypothetical protein
MSKTGFCFATVIMASATGAAMAADYPIVPPVPAPRTTPQRLSRRQVFQRLDVNHDSFLTLEEFLAAPWIKNKQRAREFFYWMDTDKDGLVSLQEFLAAYARYYCDSGYCVRVTYPWAWACWRPWRYGWYWHNGWRHRPGAWLGYAGRRHPVVGGSHHPAKRVGHPWAGRHVKHAKVPKRGHHGKHKGRGHPRPHPHQHR